MGIVSFSLFVVIFAVNIAILGFILHHTIPTIPEPPVFNQDNWFGKGEKRVQDTSIKPFEISVSQETLDDLQYRLQKTRLFDGIQHEQWEYGTNVEYLKTFVDYWRTKYDWKAQEKLLNSFPNFQTNIDGLRIHFIHVKPQVKPGQTLIPLMLIHGWPGTFYEFYKVIPILNELSKTGKFSYEIVCPSLPGYGFSEAASKPGINPFTTSIIFSKLMARLGHGLFYVQGGHFGSVTARAMGVGDRSHVKGIHINMFPRSSPYGPWSYLAGYFTLPEKEHKKTYPLKDFFLGVLIESGYFHIQATRPDSVGTGLNNSPAGLAAYIIEKFFTWSGCNLTGSSDCLESSFTKDELITNLMIYWVTNTITSSMRFYKEIIMSEEMFTLSRIPCDVPSGLPEFPHEILLTPKPWVLAAFRNNIQFSVMEKGGHFAALEVPELLTRDLVKFIEKVEALEEKKV